MTDKQGRELEPQEGSKFNVALPWLVVLLDYKIEGDKCYEMGNLEGWFKKMQNAYSFIHGKLGKTENENISGLEEDASKNLAVFVKQRTNYVMTVPPELQNTYTFRVLPELTKSLRSLDIAIEDAKHHHGFTMPKTGDPRWTTLGQT